MLKRIRRRFGDRVAQVVEECSDAFVKPKPPWRKRKKAYLSALPHKSPDTLLVSLADKVHNARAIVSDYKRHGDDLWSRFHAGKKDQLWYYTELVRGFRSTAMHRQLFQELEHVVEELQRLTARTPRRTRANR